MKNTQVRRRQCLITTLFISTAIFSCTVAACDSWNQFSATKDPEVLVTYLRQNPSSKHYREAENRIEQLYFEKEFATLSQEPRFQNIRKECGIFKVEFISTHLFPKGCDDSLCQELLIWSIAQSKRNYSSSRETISDIIAMTNGKSTDYGPFHMEMTLDPESEKKAIEAGLAIMKGTIETTTSNGTKLSLVLVPKPTSFSQFVATGSLLVTGMSHEKPVAKGVRGSVTFEQDHGDLVVKTLFPSDRIVFDPYNKAILLPNGPGSIFGISGTVKNYFQGYTFETFGKPAYFVLLKDKGLSYLAGKVEVRNELRSFKVQYP